MIAHDETPTAQTVLSYAADEIALAAVQRREQAPTCDICGSALEEPTSRGLLLWVRGDERRFEEPPLCAACSGAIDVTTFNRCRFEEEEVD